MLKRTVSAAVVEPTKPKEKREQSSQAKEILLLFWYKKTGTHTHWQPTNTTDLKTEVYTVEEELTQSSALVLSLPNGYFLQGKKAQQ